MYRENNLINVTYLKSFSDRIIEPRKKKGGLESGESTSLQTMERKENAREPYLLDLDEFSEVVFQRTICNFCIMGKCINSHCIKMY
jgi:hypothetical protein